MTWLQACVTILVALIGGSVSAIISHKQFLLKRQDEKEEKTLQKQIDDSIDKAMGRFIAECGEIGDAQIKKAKDEVRQEFEEGLKMRGQEGKERFDINSKQIAENTEMIKELLEIQKSQAEKFDILAESMTTLNKVVMASAESQRNSNYDRILIVANKALKSGIITITEKTNLKQLYQSWKDLGGSDPKIETIFEECKKLTPVPDEGV